MNIFNYKNEEVLKLVPLLTEAQDEMVKATFEPVTVFPNRSLEDSFCPIAPSPKPSPWISGAVHLLRNNVTFVVRCRDCKYNVANQDPDPYDTTDYTDIVCTYHMSDGFDPEDFCSKGIMAERN